MMKVILLAAGRGRRFGARSRRTPKCLIPLTGNENLLRRYLRAFRSLALRQIVVVVGHQASSVRRECLRAGKGLRFQFILNSKYREGSVVSLYRARAELTEDCLIMDADVYFPEKALRRLVRSRHATSFLVDKRSSSTGEEMMLMSRKGRPVRISKKVQPRLDIIGESVGFFRIAKQHGPLLKKILERLVDAGKTGVEYEESYNELMKKLTPGVETMRGLFWSEMDFEEDRLKIMAHLKKTYQA